MEMMSASIGKLAAALAAVQAELQPAKKGEYNGFFKSHYADLTACFEAVRELLPKHQLAVSQLLAPAPAQMVSIVTVLMHESGEWISSECQIPYYVQMEGNKPKTNPAQAAGSAITYARRYALAAIVGLATEDDDGNSAGQPIDNTKNASTRPSAPQNTKTNTQRVTQKTSAEWLTDEEKRQLNNRLKSCGYRYEDQPEKTCSFIGAMIGKKINDIYDLTRDGLKVFLSATEESDIPA